MTANALLIKNGTLIDPAANIEDARDVLVRDGRIADIGKKLDAPDAELFDAAGMLVMPGFIDLHAHLREPGFEEAETILTGCEAAARGGFTAVCAMPNTNPPTDDAGRVRYILGRAKHARARVYPVGAITRGREGRLIVEMGEMADAGAVAFSDDGDSVVDSMVMLNALRYSAMVAKPLLCHEEDPYLHAGGQMNEGALSSELGLKGMPRIAEETMIMRDIALAEYSGAPVHITHISTRNAVDIVRKAKARGVQVTCDVTPHHLSLTEDMVRTFDTRYKMNPPLRTPADVAAMREGLADGAIDVIATDHAPHSLEVKETEFTNAAFGVTGLETAIGVVQRELVDTGVLTWTEVVRLLSMTPAAILGIGGGTLKTGVAADITIYNPRATWTVDPGAMASKSINTAFFGWKLPGRAAATVVDGVLHRAE